MPKVSVIIPVYGVEKYIERCARSLFEQTLDDIEYLFIDDCTPDKSLDVLRKVIEDYPIRKEQIIIHKMDQNSGQAAVRKWGMLNATGDYVIHCDSDDWVDKEMYKVLYDEAIKNKADVAICDFARTDGTVYNNVCGCHDKKIDVFIDNCLFQKDHWSLCNKLFNKHCLANIIYPDGALGEDMMMCMQMLINCKRITYVGRVFYFYYFNSNSITKKRTIKQCENNYYSLKSNTDFVVDLIVQNEFPETVDVELACKYLRMINLFSLLPIKHIPKYKNIWRQNYVKMPLRFYSSDKISRYNKVIYLLSSLGLYPLHKDRAIC